jgi:energy-coupling factor transporter ATP-binding protein EcfA2
MESFQVQNYKKYADFTINFPRDMLVIFGPHGSGKTQLIWAMLMFLYIHNEGHKAGDRNALSLGGVFGVLLSHPPYRNMSSFTSLLLNAKNPLVFSAIVHKEKVEIIFKSNGVIHIQDPPTCKEKVGFAFAAPAFHFGFEHEEQKGIIDLLTFQSNLRERFRVLKPEAQKQLSVHINELFGVVLQYDQKGPHLYLQEDQGTVDIMFGGAAIQKVVAICILLFSLNELPYTSKYFFAEEIEVFLYPSLAQALLQCIRKFASAHNIYLVLTTNSTDILNSIPRDCHVPLWSTLDGPDSAKVDPAQAARNVMGLIATDTRPIVLCEGTTDISVYQQHNPDGKYRLLRTHGSISAFQLNALIDAVSPRQLIQWRDRDFKPEAALDREMKAVPEGMTMVFTSLPCLESYYVLDLFLDQDYVFSEEDFSFITSLQYASKYFSQATQCLEGKSGANFDKSAVVQDVQHTWTSAVKSLHEWKLSKEEGREPPSDDSAFMILGKEFWNRTRPNATFTLKHPRAIKKFQELQQEFDKMTAVTKLPTQSTKPTRSPSRSSKPENFRKRRSHKAASPPTE